MGNTVGSRTKPRGVDWAYITGFFDGDGRLMAQVKNRRDRPTGWRIMFTICLYQDTRHKEPLEWMRNLLDIGYIHDRKDGISEFRINGYGQVKRILEGMKPFVRFKKKQVSYALSILDMLEGNSFPSLSRSDRLRAANWMIKLREANY
jgi:hypothetical protein